MGVPAARVAVLKDKLEAPVLQPHDRGDVLERCASAGLGVRSVKAVCLDESSSLALEVYAKVMERKRDTGERLDALVRGADWAPTGTNDVDEVVPVVSLENKRPLKQRPFEAAGQGLEP